MYKYYAWILITTWPIIWLVLSSANLPIHQWKCGNLGSMSKLGTHSPISTPLYWRVGSDGSSALVKRVHSYILSWRQEPTHILDGSPAVRAHDSRRHTASLHFLASLGRIKQGLFATRGAVRPARGGGGQSRPLPTGSSPRPASGMAWPASATCRS